MLLLESRVACDNFGQDNIIMSFLFNFLWRCNKNYTNNMQVGLLLQVTCQMQ